MFTITKRIEIAGSHQLNLPYESKCCYNHGHNWIVTVEILGDVLNQDGMLLDFCRIKKVIEQLDHTFLNNIIPQPTAENIAQWIADQIQKEIHDEDYQEGGNEFTPWVSKVSIQESEGNTACYIP